VRSPFNTSSLAQAAGLAALDDHEHVARSRQHNARELRFLQERLADLGKLGIKFTPSVANFVLVDTARDGDAVFAALLRRGIIVRPMRASDLPTCIRVSIGTHEENLLFLRILEETLGEALPTH
jgi:histidinol-phosphate aminotransferase